MRRRDGGTVLLKTYRNEERANRRFVTFVTHMTHICLSDWLNEELCHMVQSRDIIHRRHSRVISGRLILEMLLVNLTNSRKWWRHRWWRKRWLRRCDIGRTSIWETWEYFLVMFIEDISAKVYGFLRQKFSITNYIIKIFSLLNFSHHSLNHGNNWTGLCD